ncbi:MAG: hypothetical protein NTY20_03750 [Candidatus Aenigmarchaeota archaeon]|nr:hypothetical protein [Candidatus Aenigmarchaeota archaeon]
MKLKTLGRIGGAVEASVFGYFGYHGAKLMSDIDYSRLGDLFLGDYPIEHKLLGGAYVMTISASVSLCALGAAEGLTDVAKGTHHYFGCKLLKKVIKNEQKKKEIDKELERQLELIEKPISLRGTRGD